MNLQFIMFIFLKNNLKYNSFNIIYNLIIFKKLKEKYIKETFII